MEKPIVESEEISEERVAGVDENQDIDNFNECLCASASELIPKSRGKMMRRAVPWWTEECNSSIRARNRAFRLLKRTHN